MRKKGTANLWDSGPSIALPYWIIIPWTLELCWMAIWAGLGSFWALGILMAQLITWQLTIVMCMRGYRRDPLSWERYK